MSGEAWQVYKAIYNSLFSRHEIDSLTDTSLQKLFNKQIWLSILSSSISTTSIHVTHGKLKS